MIYTTAHGNPGSLTHWVRPGIKPVASWFLVGFISAAPRWELLPKILNILEPICMTFLKSYVRSLDFFITFFFFLPFFRAAAKAYGGSQARGPIGAAARAYTRATAMPDPSCVCNLHDSSQQCRILNPTSKASD